MAAPATAAEAQGPGADSGSDPIGVGSGTGYRQKRAAPTQALEIKICHFELKKLY